MCLTVCFSLFRSRSNDNDECKKRSLRCLFSLIRPYNDNVMSHGTVILLCLVRVNRYASDSIFDSTFLYSSVYLLQHECIVAPEPLK